MSSGTAAGRGGPRRGAGRPRRVDLDDAVLGAVATLLAERGYDALRIDDVSAAAGAAKSTLYRRWPSKPAMVAAAVERLTLSEVVVPDTGDLRSDLVTLLRDTYGLMSAGPGRVLADLVRDSARHPELSVAIRHTMHARRRRYLEVFNRALTRGDLAATTDVGLAIDLLLGPLWVRLLLTDDPVDEETVDATVDAVLDGILVRRRRRR